MRLPPYVITPRVGRPLTVRILGATHNHYSHHPVIQDDDGKWESCDFPDAPLDDRLAADRSDLMLHERLCRQQGGMPNEGECPWCRLHFLREDVYFWNVVDRHDGVARVLKLDRTSQLNLLAAAASIVRREYTPGPPDMTPHGVTSLGYLGTLSTYDYELIAVPSLGYQTTASPYEVSVQPKPGSLSPLSEDDWLAVRLLNSGYTTLEEARRLRDLTTIVQFVPLSYESQRDSFGEVLWPDPALAAEDAAEETDETGPLDHLRLPPVGEWEE